MKSGEKIPFGYLAETILQAAIVAKFTTKRDSTVSVMDVIKFLKEEPSLKTISLIISFCSSVKEQKSSI